VEVVAQSKSIFTLRQFLRLNEKLVMSNVPLVAGRISWLGLAVQFAIIFGLYWLFRQVSTFDPILLAAITHAIFARVLRNLVAKNHRKGMRLVRAGQFESAIPEFEKSVEKFKKHKWLDQYRVITMLSAVGTSYLAMGYTNLGFCHSQLGHKDEAKQYYQQVLQLDPTNGNAKAAMNMLN
jgi:tetratricopeptide (TPR) repeat protein